MLLTLNQFREYFLTSPHSVADRWLVTHFCMTYSLSFFNSVILRLLPRMSYSNLYRIIIYFAVCNFQGTMLADLIKSIKTCQDCKVEIKGFEPLTPCLQGRCSPNWAIPPEVWHPLMFPRRYQRSIFSRSGLNHRVRDGNGCYPWPHRHQTNF